MIIRSQDGRRIARFREAYVCEGCSSVYVNGLCFGVYENEKEAVKVIDEIFSAVANMAFNDGATYQMPQKVWV